jgi:cation transport ATPase
VIWHLLMTPMAAAGLVEPWVAAITMLVSSLAVAANSWRLFRRETLSGTASWPAAPARS